MGNLNTVPQGKALELRDVAWFRLWRMTRPTTVYVDGEQFAANAGDALGAGPGHLFRRVVVEGEALVEHSNDPNESFPGPVPGARSAVLLYDSGVLTGPLDHDALIDLSPYSRVAVYAKDNAKLGGLYVTHDGDDESALVYDFTAGGSTDNVLFSAPMQADSASPDSASGNRIHAVVGYPTPLPGSVRFHLLDASGTGGRLAVWGWP